MLRKNRDRNFIYVKVQFALRHYLTLSEDKDFTRLRARIPMKRADIQAYGLTI